MWKFLILNALWFIILFIVQFVGSPKDRKIVFAAIFCAASYMAFKTSIDPFAWLAYLMYSLIVYYGAYQFKTWAYASSIVMEEEIDLASKELGKVHRVVEEKTWEADQLARTASEISGLYDKIKEMSKSLEYFEIFLIFGEALSENFEFQSIKLVLFDEENLGMIRQEEVYELQEQDFRGLFDRSALIKNRSKAFGTLFPADAKIFNYIFKKIKPVLEEDLKEIFAGQSMQSMALVAYPMFVEKKIFGVVIVSGLQSKKSKLLNILIERFVSEMERARLYERVQKLAITDGLTGVYVRRHLLDRLDGELDRSKRFGFKLSFLMIDIDYFKNFNDSYGHLVGDVVLKQVAETIRSSVREVDLVGRYGGEEFGVLLIETDESLAFMVAERIRRSVEEKEFKAYDEKLKVTVSIGCSTYSYYEVGDASMIIESADSALYQAKRQGRNKVCLFNLPSPQKD